MTRRRGGLEAMLAGSVLDLAPRLLGATVQTEVGGRVTAVMLTEVEAYMGADDPASHAYRGETPRNGSMFREAGTLYVYRSYGIHWCMNIVVGEPGLPHAILLRGGRPTEGIGLIEERRGRRDHLADGPGKLCQALAVTGRADGSNVFEGPVVVSPGSLPDGESIETTTRIGISRAVDAPWRWVVTG